MNVDFLHNQIIRDTVTPIFIESFNENLLPRLENKYSGSLEYVQFYEDHIKDGMRIGGIFYYPLTVVVSGTAKVEWISWQVSNYRIYDNFNPFSYKGQELLTFFFADYVPAEVKAKIEGKPIYAKGNNLPVIMKAETDDKTFLAGKYSQGFIDLMAVELTEIIEKELTITGLAGSGVVLEMNFAPGTYMEHVVANTTYRRLRIKARACSARDLWVKWTRLDGNGTYTISDNVDRSMIRFELAEDVPGKIKEKEYRYITRESVEKYQESMGRKNITEWREMMRRVIRRGEVEKYERITISKPAYDEPEEKEEETPIPEPVTVPPVVEKVTIPSAKERDRDEITERLNALLGKSDVEFSREPEALAESINSDLNELLRGALGVSAPKVEEESEAVAEETEALEEGCEAIADEIAETEDETDEECDVDSEEIEETEECDTVAEEVYEAVEEAPTKDPRIDESEIEARIRRELEEKMRAEMDELRRKNEEAEALREKLEAQKRAEAREKELLAEAARQAILDTERREADRRAEEERDRIEAERRAEEARRAEEEAKKAEAARLEQQRIEAELRAAAEKAEAPVAPKEEKPQYVSKTVTLIFRGGGVDKNMTKRVHEIIIATIKYLGKENVYMRIKASVPDPSTLVLNFSEIPIAEQQLIVDLIQVLGKSGIGITKATLE